jgi:hypothetical protein
MAESPPSDDDPRDFYSPEQVDEIVGARAAIEQAKGMLMFVYDVDADTAFDMLRRQSRTASVKLRLLAQQLVNDVAALNERICTQRAATCCSPCTSAFVLPRKIPRALGGSPTGLSLPITWR